MTPVRPSRFLWLESELWRKAIKARDTVFTVFVVDPVIRLVLPVVLLSGLSPNAVTVAAFGLSLLSAWLMLQGSLVAGGVFFVLWYVFDCIDGKVARLTDRCTKFGWWLDVAADRLGTGVVLFALGTYHLRSGAELPGLLAFALLCTWFLGTLNTISLAQVAESFSARERASRSGAEGSRRGLRSRLNRMRLGGWIVHDIEFLILGVALGPSIGRPTLCLGLAVAGMALQKTGQTLIFWWRRRAEITTV